jgi:hypothetical protein
MNDPEQLSAAAQQFVDSLPVSAHATAPIAATINPMTVRTAPVVLRDCPDRTAWTASDARAGSHAKRCMTSVGGAWNKDVIAARSGAERGGGGGSGGAAGCTGGTAIGWAGKADGIWAMAVAGSEASKAATRQLRRDVRRLKTGGFFMSLAISK